ncbi:MAG: TIM barrel protein [candidate division Zixibacteria bacterium]|nr:TIM barrel protein [candidate division Zixibacteria bacterium]
MRLGIVGMVPGDPRAITAEHLRRAGALNITTVCYHIGEPILSELTAPDCRGINDLYTQEGLELAQMGIGYRECLFDPDAETRNHVVRLIDRGIETACRLNAGMALIRTGSLNPAGAYSPSRRNIESGRLEQLVETLRRVADKAEHEGMTIVIETHLLTLMGSPEINRQVIEAVGSSRMKVVMDFVNHFQSLEQVYNSTSRIDHIFDVMGDISSIAHIKDIKLSDGLVLHIDEEVPGEGELDLVTAVRRWEALYPTGYMLVEHLPDDRIPTAVANVHRIAREAGVSVT